MVDQNKYVFCGVVLLLLAGLQTATAKEQPLKAPAADSECLTSIGAAHLPRKMPLRLVQAISTVEAGRLNLTTRRVVPWPWTINVGGNGYFYQSKMQAVAAVLVLQGAGIRSIDVGCMQINLMYHPHAFTSLEDAFTPSVNVAYAIGFLSNLFSQTGSWPAATAAYHSQTSLIGAEYEKRVMVLYPMKTAKPIGGVGTVDPSGLTPEMLRLNQESQQDQDRLRVLFGSPALTTASAPERVRSVRLAGRAATATANTPAKQKRLLQLADRSWLNGATTN